MPRHAEFQSGSAAGRRNQPGRRPADPKPVFRELRRIAGTLTLRTAPLRQPEPPEGERT